MGIKANMNILEGEMVVSIKIQNNRSYESKIPLVETLKHIYGSKQRYMHLDGICDIVLRAEQPIDN